MSLVELEELEVAAGSATLVEGLSLRLEPGRVAALVGESGSGKTVSALALVGLLPAGLRARWRRLVVDGAPVSDTPSLAPLRGRTLAYLPQDALGALDPVMRVGRLIDEVLETVARVSNARDREAAREALLAEVGFTDPRAVSRLFPHQLSGGMGQRVSLAATLAAKPRVLLVDEPTAALDASLRQSVLEGLRGLVEGRRLSLLFITHDLAAAEAIADEVLVLYAGRVAEAGALPDVFSSPQHPYTAGLLGARLDRGEAKVMAGAIPPLGERPEGCRFQPRCARASAACASQPGLLNGVACFHPLVAR